MLDLNELPAELLINRGKYTSVRAAHEDALKAMQVKCGALAAAATAILRRVQIDDDQEPSSVSDLLASARKLTDEIEQCAAEIDDLAKQRAELKPLAWPR